MQLLTEDVEFESESSCIILPPAVDQKTTPTVITLSGNVGFSSSCYCRLFFVLNKPFFFRHSTQTRTSQNCRLFNDCAWFEKPLQIEKCYAINGQCFFFYSCGPCFTTIICWNRIAKSVTFLHTAAQLFIISKLNTNCFHKFL